MKYTTHTLNAKQWTPWILPVLKGYRIRCCDCSLVHELQFKVTATGRVLFKARRDERATKAARKARS